MSKKKIQQQINTLRSSIEKNKKDGFVPLVSDKNILGVIQPLVSEISLGYSPESLATDANDELNAGPLAIKFGQTFAEPTLNVIPKDDENLPGNGAVSWGVRNSLPAYIYKTAKTLPYTAQALEYQANASCGIRPQFLYNYSVVRNGILAEESCDFHLAGKLLISKIRELRQLIQEEKAQNPDPVPSVVVPQPPSPFDQSSTQEPAPVGENSQLSTLNSQLYSYRTKPDPYTPDIPLSDVPDSDIGSLQTELDELIAEYRKWFRADIELREFEKNNDLSKLMNDLAQDDIALDLNFPLVGLEQGDKTKWASPEWTPKIVSLSFSPAVISRFEKKEDDHRIHYVYANEKWRYHLTKGTAIKTKSNTVAYPLIRWQDFHGDLEEYIRAARSKKGSGWQSWYAVPNKHLSTEQEYYTFPAWWSLYPSLTLMYATTLMFDKSIARKNDIAWRRIIYVDRGYLEDLYAADEKGQDPERQKEIRDELEAKVNNFLSNKANNGKTLMVDSTVSEDGKTLINSIRVETIPETSQKATEEEIHAISSVIFYALGLDPRLVGAVPGKQNSSSGTQARELELLNTKKLAVRRERFKRLLINIATHNDWCPDRISIAIVDQNLSTLDRSSTGIVETES